MKFNDNTPEVTIAVLHLTKSRQNCPIYYIRTKIPNSGQILIHFPINFQKMSGQFSKAVLRALVTCICAYTCTWLGCDSFTCRGSPWLSQCPELSEERCSTPASRLVAGGRGRLGSARQTHRTCACRVPHTCNDSACTKSSTPLNFV